MCGTVIKTDSNTQSVVGLKIFYVLVFHHKLVFLGDNQGSVLLRDNSSQIVTLEMQFYSSDKREIEFFCVLFLGCFAIYN